MEIYVVSNNSVLRKSSVHWDTKGILYPTKSDSINSLIPNYEIKYSKKLSNGKKVFMCVSATDNISSRARSATKNPNIITKPQKRNTIITNLLCARKIINVQFEYQNLGLTDTLMIDDFTQKLMSHNRILSQLMIQQFSGDLPAENQILNVILEQEPQLEILGTVAIVACLNDRLVDLEMDEMSEYLSMFLK